MWDKELIGKDKICGEVGASAKTCFAEMQLVNATGNGRPLGVDLQLYHAIYFNFFMIIDLSALTLLPVLVSRSRTQTCNEKTLVSGYRSI